MIDTKTIIKDKSNISIVNNKMIYDKQNTNSKMEYIDYGFIMIKN